MADMFECKSAFWEYLWVTDQVPGTSTTDFSAFLSVSAALDFRKAIGGEKKIMDYCHFLALAGGRAMANILGTTVLDNTDSGEFTAAMVSNMISSEWNSMLTGIE